MNIFLKSCDLHLQDLLRNSPWDFGDKNYTKFIILGRSRVGSNMLRSILNKSREIISYGELFRTKGKVGWDMQYYRPHRIDLFNESSSLEDNPIEFLDKRIYKNYRESINAVGFKIFYYHARQDEWKKVWNYLQKNDIKIIHLKRKDLLRVYVSRFLAEKTGDWKNKKYDKAVNLDPSLCEEDFQRTEQWWIEADEFFKDSPLLELCYEDLIAERNHWTKKILDFLGVKVKATNLNPSTKKQSKKNTSELIRNYEEIEKYFLNTKWEYLFKSNS